MITATCTVHVIRVIQLLQNTLCCLLSLCQVMNELVVDRGPHPYLCNLELFCNGRFMTSVQGDGEYMYSYM